jgi:hypothetical protein
MILALPLLGEAFRDVGMMPGAAGSRCELLARLHGR